MDAAALQSGSRQSVLGLRYLVEAAAIFGIEPEEVLAGLSIAQAALSDPDAEVTLAEHVRAVRNASNLGADLQLLGTTAGLSANLTQIGLFGFAAMASGSLRELLVLSLRYFSFTNLVLNVEVQEGPVTSEVVFSDSHLPEDVRPYFVARDAAAIVGVVPMFAGDVIGKYAPESVAILNHGDEAIVDLVAAFGFGGVEITDGPRALRFPTSMLDEPLPQADAHTVATCLEQCEVTVQRRHQRVGLSADVRSLLISDPSNPPSVDHVADSLHLHPRTLRRRLVEEGTSYRDLLNEVRHSLAVELLSEVGLTVEEVARRLGYTETAAFSHAFTRWSGQPPSSYRRNLAR